MNSLKYIAGSILFLGISNVLAAPSTPSLLTPQNGQPNLTLTNGYFSWSPSTNAISYRIVVSKDRSFSGFNNTTGKCDSTCGTTGGLKSTYQYRNLSMPATTYYWKVAAYDSKGVFRWSAVNTFTTTKPTVVTPLSSSYMRNVSQEFGGWNNNFGGYHTGFDISTSNANPNVYALDGGTVVFNSTNSSNYNSSFTKYFNGFVIIKHDTGYFAYYGHLNSQLSANSKVNKGDTIGYIRDAYDSGNRLNRSNNHLHISISKGSDWIRSGWGYQKTNTGITQFTNPKSYIGL